MKHTKNALSEETSEATRKNLQTPKPSMDVHNLSPNDFETLVEVFRTLLKWQNERDELKNKTPDGCGHN